MKLKASIVILVLFAGLCGAQGQKADWLLTKADMNYAGGFRLPKGAGGKGKNDHFAFSPGVIAFDRQRNSFFAAGHNYAKAIAEVSFPGLVNSTDIAELPRAEYRQNFRNLIDSLPSGNPDKVGVLGGLYARDGVILFTAFQYYDAAAKVRDVFGTVQDSSTLETSALSGYFETVFFSNLTSM